jgi:hypothetical protein
VFRWRSAIVLGAIFIVIGLIYLTVQGGGLTMDRAGVTLFLVLGAAMMFTFIILLRGSRGL